MGARGARVFALVVVAALLGACPAGPLRNTATTPKNAPRPSVHDGTWGSFRTLSAEHRVVVEARTADGGTARKTMHGLIAVARPDRFRLRALGPAGITLFDVVDVAGDVKILKALPLPPGQEGTSTTTLISSIAADLAAAFDLSPRPGNGSKGGDRTVRADGDAIIVEDADRSIRLQSWTGRGENAVPTHIEIENRPRHYRVQIDAVSSSVDTTLDPTMFGE